MNAPIAALLAASDKPMTRGETEAFVRAAARAVKRFTSTNPGSDPCDFSDVLSEVLKAA